MKKIKYLVFQGLVRVGVVAILLVTGVWALESLEPLQVGGRYWLRLTTGDELEGVVDSKDDTTLVLSTDKGGYTFKGNLIDEFGLVAPPPVKEQRETVKKPSTENLTYPDLVRRGTGAGTVEVRLNTGVVYVGVLSSADEYALNLTVLGSVVPIDPMMITAIATVSADGTPPGSGKHAVQTAKQEIADTVLVINPMTDDMGVPLEPIALVGSIIADKQAGITLRTAVGSERIIPRDRVVRVIRHSTSAFEEPIIRYAKPLFCPEGMALVDIPPGVDSRPFFKVCIDRYEYPNQPGTVPRGNVSYEEARKLCGAQGKRLCTDPEWQWSCSGMEGYAYPYGWHFEKAKCNIDGTRLVEPSGNRRSCVGKFGLVDMTGNIFEWVSGEGMEPMLMGGPYSKCQTVSPGVGGQAKPQTGLRCCYSN